MKKEEMNSIEENREYCTCNTPEISSDIESSEWGFYDVCAKCGKRLNDDIHYYNHYDGEDHDDTELYNY